MYAPLNRNDPNNELTPDSSQQVRSGSSFLTTLVEPGSLLESDALAQARRAIPSGEPPAAIARTAPAIIPIETYAAAGTAPQSAPPAVMDALHSPNISEHVQAAQTGRELLNTLQSVKQQKQSVDSMITLLVRETRLARRRRRARWAKNACVLMGIACLLAVTQGRIFGSFWWLFSLGGYWWVAEQLTKQREVFSEAGVPRAVGTQEPVPLSHDLSLGDPGAVGALAAALRDSDKSIQHTATEALLVLLPRVRASHTVHVTPDQMNALLELAFRSSSGMQIAVLKALEQIGDQRAIPLVQNLALSPHRAVRDQARQCLPFLTTRARQAEQSATLLRGAASPSVTAGGRELLRPVASQTEAATRRDELLRPANPAS